MSLTRKYVDKYYDGHNDVATAFTLIFGASGIAIILCFVGIFICIFGGENG